MTESWPFGDLKPGHYGAILADPPWHFEVWAEGSNRNASSKYQTMRAGDIAALPQNRNVQNQEDAARAYDTAAREHFGEFARLNFEAVA